MGTQAPLAATGVIWSNYRLGENENIILSDGERDMTFTLIKVTRTITLRDGKIAKIDIVQIEDPNDGSDSDSDKKKKQRYSTQLLKSLGFFFPCLAMFV